MALAANKKQNVSLKFKLFKCFILKMNMIIIMIIMIIIIVIIIY